MKSLKLLILVVIVLISVSCNDNTSNPDDDQKLRIAAIIDLTGHYSEFGLELRQALDIAFNSTDNCFSIWYYDAKGDTVTAHEILDSIIKDRSADVVISLLSWVSNSLAQKIHDNNMLQVAVGSAVFNYANLNSCVRFTGDVNSESQYLAEQLQEYNSIAVMYFDNDYGKGWMNTLSAALGSKIVTSEKYVDVQTDFTTELQRIKTINPEIIVLISTSEAAIIVKQARQLGINSQMIGTRPTLTNSLLAEPLAEGMIFSYPDLNDNLHVYQEFLAAYHYKMSAFGAEGYDLIMTLNEAYLNKVSDRNILFNFYVNKNHSGALGNIRFNVNAQADYDYTFMVIKNGSFEKLE